jgi:N-acetylmuramoyl-L-alanine amidase CwlA
LQLVTKVPTWLKGDLMKIDEARNKLNIKVDLIPRTNKNRQGTKITPTHITIHNTDNSSKGADALAHAKYVKGPDAVKRNVSWHFTIDDKRCVRHLPLDEKAIHAGKANLRSIAIEVCQNEDQDQEAAIERACLLTAVLMHERNIKAANIVPHKHWTGKNCPRVILKRQGGMKRFVERASELFAQIEA